MSSVLIELARAAAAVLTAALKVHEVFNLQVGKRPRGKHFYTPRHLEK